MKQTIGLSQFRDAFYNMNRKDNFSYEGLELLFDYFEELDENMELDVIAICCDFSELSLGEVLTQYDDITDEVLSEDNEAEIIEYVTDYLDSKTMLVGVTSDNKFLFQQF